MTHLPENEAAGMRSWVEASLGNHHLQVENLVVRLYANTEDLGFALNEKVEIDVGLGFGTLPFPPPTHVR